ncbi:esterase-like activity of phytase-domain-containing protein [Hypoxylon sp. NC0597]|nr:esterase-like activity of phytase-domain-containing protein [Hypoxylon sp. NC0597]
MNALLVTVSLAASTYGAVVHDRVGATALSTVNKTTCNGIDYKYEELAGYGYVVSDAVDKFGDTLGGLGSSIHLEQGAWRKLDNGSFSGILWSLPDRGWNTQGTLNFNPRVHKFNIILTPQPSATVDKPSGYLSYTGFPDLPAATYAGDGFGGKGPGGKRIPVDAEGLWVNDDSSFWVSDEYGPYIYLFGPDGKMLTAVRPNGAIVPTRNGSTSFSANSPPFYIDNGEGDDVDPADPDNGRDNNHGFEGLTISEDGKSLWVLLQAAAVQEGGLDKQTQRNVRLLKYDISNRASPVYVGEWVVPLPLYDDPTAEKSKNPHVAAQSEILALENGQFFVLSRDSGAGHGTDNPQSLYRQIDIFDISDATDIRAKGDYDCVGCNIAKSKSGELKKNITPATYCSFLDFNVNTQLNRFGVHNGGDQDQYLLNEKWESLGMVPIDPSSPNGEFYMFSLSDNDFITQNGFMDGGKLPYADGSGYNLDSQALVFKIRIST